MKLSFMSLASAAAAVASATVTPTPEDGVALNSYGFYARPGWGPIGHIDFSANLKSDFSAIEFWAKFGNLTYPLPSNANPDVEHPDYAIDKLDLTLSFPVFFPTEKYNLKVTSSSIVVDAYLPPRRVTVEGSGKYWIGDGEEPASSPHVRHHTFQLGGFHFGQYIVPSFKLHGLKTETVENIMARVTLEFKGRGTGNIGLLSSETGVEVPFLTLGLEWEKK